MTYQKQHYMKQPSVVEEYLAVSIDVIENRHAAKVLLMLYRKGPMFKTAIYTELGKGTSIGLRRVMELKDAGLVEEKKETVRPFAQQIQLTEKGKEIAEHLKVVEEILAAI